MTTEYQHCCEILGLSTDAGPDEMKRAFFRLVRQHPPEKDPEQFQQIRHAYEVLKEGPPTMDQESFPEPQDPETRFWLSHAFRLLGEGDEKAAVACITEALKFEPNDPFLLLNLAKMQLRAGNPRKAAKTAQKLAELKPDFAEAHALAAQGMLDGSWYKKALPEYRKAYELGWRELDFQVSYADTADANGYEEEADRLRRELLQNTRWDRENKEAAIYLYSRQVEHCRFNDEKTLSILREYEQFLRENKRLLKDLGIGTAAPLRYLMTIGRIMSQDVYLAVDAMMDTIGKQNPGDFEEELMRARFNLIMDRLEVEEEFPVILWQMLTASLFPDVDNEDTQIQRFALLDTILCMNCERETIRKQWERIREKYPLLYEKAKEPISVVFAENNEKQIEKLRKEYDRLNEIFDARKERWILSISLKRNRPTS